MACEMPPPSRKETVKKSLLMLPIALIAMAMALTACGGGGSSSSGSSGGGEEGAVEAAIEASATGTDPSKCTEAQTQTFNETDTGKTGATQSLTARCHPERRLTGFLCEGAESRHAVRVSS